MFEAELRPARMLKQIIEALKEVVDVAQFECSAEQMVVQAMDSSHVSLVGLELNAEKFHKYRCEKPLTLGIHVNNLAKMLKCAGNDDTVKLTADDNGDTLNVRLSDELDERVSEFSMKLMELDGETLGIPQQEYAAAVRMPSVDFSRICKDIANFGDTVTIDVKKDTVSFSAQGDIGTGRMVLKAGKEADMKPAPAPKKEEPVAAAKEEAKEEVPTTVKQEPGVTRAPAEQEASKKPEAAEEEDEDDDEDEEEKDKKKMQEEEDEKETAVKPEAETKPETKSEKSEEGAGSDTPPAKKRRSEKTEEEKEEKALMDGLKAAEREAEKEKKEKLKKEKAEQAAKVKAEKAEQKEKDLLEKEEREREEAAKKLVKIECKEPVSLQFALRYLTMFSRAQSVTETVWMRLAKDIPLQMEYEIMVPKNEKDAPAGTSDDERMGSLRYYLAPKVGDDVGDDAAAPAANADDE